MFATSKRLRALERRTDQMAGELEALRAAIAADAENDAKLIAFLADTKAKLDEVNAKLTAALSQEIINPADVQAAADALNAHIADVASHLPAADAPATN